MHYEVLVEDQSGAFALEALLAKILGANGGQHSYRIHSYKGIGRIPPKVYAQADPRYRLLLDQLPRILRGYGKALQNFDSAVIVVIDLDKKDCITFKEELVYIWNNCDPKPRALFRIAIEEIEAWLLGDTNAIKEAYPRAIENALNSYVQDSICDTWEKLADAIYKGGSAQLKKLGWPYIGQAKCEWAQSIAPKINIETNSSKSFQVFRQGILKLAQPSL